MGKKSGLFRSLAPIFQLCMRENKFPSGRSKILISNCNFSLAGKPNFMIRSILLFLVLSQLFVTRLHSQKLRKADKAIISELQADISYLSNVKLEGRRSGTKGESMASDYIIGEFSKTGLKPLGDSSSWLQTFEIYDGRDISHTVFRINNSTLALTTEYIPLPFSASGKIEGSSAVALQESGSPWFYDLKETMDAVQSNPHFDMNRLLREKVKVFAGKGASAVIFYNRVNSICILRVNNEECYLSPPDRRVQTADNKQHNCAHGRQIILLRRGRIR